MVSFTYFGILLCLVKIVASTVVDQCTDDIFADPDSCGHFYKCDNGKPVRFTCPDNLYYNIHSKVCDWPSNVQCDVNTGKRPDASTGSSGQTTNSNNSNNNNNYDNTGSEGSQNTDNQDQGSSSQFDGYDDQTDDGKDNNDLFYPVQTVDAQDPDVAPILPSPPPGTDFSERPRRTVDDLLSEDNNPYEDALDNDSNNGNKS